MSLAAEGAGGAPGRAAADSTQHYRRLAWLTISLAFVAFCVVCVGLGVAAVRYSQHAYEANTATVEIAYGTKLEVRRARTRNWTLVTDSTVLNEGDSVSTGQDTQALIRLFDGSTVQLYYSSTVTLKVMRTSRFLDQFKDIQIVQDGGSLKAATAALQDYGSMKFHVVSADGETVVAIPESSAALITVPDPPAGSLQMTVATQLGAVSVRTNGPALPVPLGQMLQTYADGTTLASPHAQAELITNGDFKARNDLGQAPSLLAPGWSLSPSRQVLQAEGVAAEVDTETLGGQVEYTARFSRPQDSSGTPKVTLTQDLADRAVNFYQSLLLHASVRVVYPQNQTPPLGNGPLTISVIYSDAEGRQQTWQRSFYAQPSPLTTEFDPGAALVPLRVADWTDLPPSDGGTWDLMTQSPQPARINSVQITVEGSSFDVSVSKLSLIAK